MDTNKRECQDPDQCDVAMGCLHVCKHKTVTLCAWELDELKARVRREALADAARVAGPEDSFQDEWFKARADAVNRIKALPGA